MTMKIAINTKTTGKFELKTLNNREHIVTDMIPIVGNSIMNNGFYPLTEVQNSFQQLHFLPAPNGHPTVENQLVSAFHPLAVNAFNIGGMVRNPKMDGDKVINEFWLDVDVANRSDDGKELIRRIQNNEKVGVSTGLSVTQEVTNGSHDGAEYGWIARNMQFDHVAILLNEKAAGDHVGTALKTNSVMVCNCAILGDTGISLPQEKGSMDNIINTLKGMFDLKPKANAISTQSLESQLAVAAREKFPKVEGIHVWLARVFPTIDTVIFEMEKDGLTTLLRFTYVVDSNDQVSLNDDAQEVVKKEEFVEVDGDVNILANSPMEDQTMSNPKNEQDVTNTDANAIEKAVNLLESKGFKVNTKQEAEQIQFFVDNRAKFEAVINAEENRLADLRAKLVANSDFTDEDVAGMSETMLVKLGNQLQPKQNYAINAGSVQRKVANSEVSEEDIGNFIPDYDETDGGK